MIPLAEVDPLKNVHIFYQYWVKSVQNNQYSEFMNLWETCMIRSTSEAIRETAGSNCGSMMNQHDGKNLSQGLLYLVVLVLALNIFQCSCTSNSI